MEIFLKYNIFINMKKQTLNEEISRIKGIMGMIVNEQFEGSQENAPSEMAKKIASDILSDVTNRPIEKYDIFDDNVFDGSEVMFAFANDEGSLYYYFDVDFSSHSSSSPATYYEPESHDDAEYDFKPKYMEVSDGTNVLYKGKDFTNIMDVKLSNGNDVESYAYEKFDEEIQIWSYDNGSGGDRWDTEDYRDNDY
jgi:hypothetical protein